MDVRARSLIALIRSGDCGLDGERYEEAITELTKIAVSVLRSHWDPAHANVDDRAFLHPPAEPENDTIESEKVREVIFHSVFEMYKVVHVERNKEDYRLLPLHFSAILNNFGDRLAQKEESWNKGRVTLTVDGPNGPEKKRIYADRSARVDATSHDENAYRDFIAVENEKDFERYCTGLVDEAYQRATPTDRRTLNERKQGFSAEVAGLHVGTTGQTVINRHRKLVTSIDPEAHAKLRLSGDRKQVQARKTGKQEQPPGRTTEGAVSSPRRKPGD